MISNSTFNRALSIKIILILCLFISFSLKSQNIEKENTPGARWGHVFIYDQNQQQILLFGGTSQQGGTTYLNDTWIWKNELWEKMDVQGPSPRGFCAYAYNEERKTIILHGGRGNKGITYSDLWEWNGKKWIQLENESQFKADHHQLIYLNNKKTLLAFGGWNGNDVMGDTWTWDGEWKKLNISSPPKRASFAMVKDNKKDRVVLYGGLWVNGQYADIWEWSNNKWKSLSGMYDNSSIDHHSMIYNSKSECIIGFGGKDYRYQFQKKTFTIENGKIIVISDEGPSERHSFGFTYNGDKNLVYLYGGKEYVNGEQVALSDFWKWDGEKWKRIEYKNISKN